MKLQTKPVLLLSDSQLLFGKHAEQLLKPLFQTQLGKAPITAAYIGAANDDEPAFYDIFEAGMAQCGIQNTCKISKEFTAVERQQLADAQLILLAGGDVAYGWSIITASGMADVLRQRYFEGCLLVGISAGAVHLSFQGWESEDLAKLQTFPTLNVAHLLVDCHDEANQWYRLKKHVNQSKTGLSGVGIPFGAGLLVNPDQSMQALVKPIEWYQKTEEGILVHRQMHPNA